MLPLGQKIAFLIFALLTGALGARGFYRVYLRVRRGRPSTEDRTSSPLRRLQYALMTTITQRRTFRGRPAVSFFHAFIFYGFAFYILVNLVDAIEGYWPFVISSSQPIGALYNLCADILSLLILVGVVALVLRRFFLPSRRDFSFNPRTLLDPKVTRGAVTRDSLIVSGFILFHVGSRIAGESAKLRLTGPDPFQPFATLFSRLISPSRAGAWFVFGYWGALGSVLLFLAYFPWSKHIHIFMAPLKYFFRRAVNSGELPAADLSAASLELQNAPEAEGEAAQIGAEKLEDLAWPRLLDAFACIQCNRCQDACPATATGKALSPSALEINKRMELNRLGVADGVFGIGCSRFEQGAASPRSLLESAISREALWACTTCGACLEVCPVQDEPMLDIIDIRRNQVMMKGEFPAALQSAFRGMERASNPWGIGRDRRLAWAEGLPVKTVEEHPEAQVLYWVGCAASYDPQAQRTARAFVQLLVRAQVDFAVLGKSEACTGDSARRAGNEYLYRQLAVENIRTLDRIRPQLIVATCPHCMNAIGKEYGQLGAHYKVMHHTEFLEQLLKEGRLEPQAMPGGAIAFHDPCYLGRHNGVYDAPRNLLKVLTGELVELERNRAGSFCCGAGGAQFWKEEEPGSQRISDNRYREAEAALGTTSGAKVLAVGCPFCKSMLESTPGKGTAIEIKDVAELLLEGVERRAGKKLVPPPVTSSEEKPQVPVLSAAAVESPKQNAELNAAPPAPPAHSDPPVPASPSASSTPRKAWNPKAPAVPAESPSADSAAAGPGHDEAIDREASPAASVQAAPSAPRKAWKPKAVEVDKPPAEIPSAAPTICADSPAPADAGATAASEETRPPRKAWKPKSG